MPASFDFFAEPATSDELPDPPEPVDLSMLPLVEPELVLPVELPEEPVVVEPDPLLPEPLSEPPVELDPLLPELGVGLPADPEPPVPVVEPLVDPIPPELDEPVLVSLDTPVPLLLGAAPVRPVGVRSESSLHAAKLNAPAANMPATTHFLRRSLLIRNPFFEWS